MRFELMCAHDTLAVSFKIHFTCCSRHLCQVVTPSHATSHSAGLCVGGISLQGGGRSCHFRAEQLNVPRQANTGDLGICATAARR